MGGPLSDISNGSECAPLEELPLSVNSTVDNQNNFLNLILQGAEEARLATTVSLPQDAPIGMIELNQTTATDSNGRQYYKLLEDSGGGVGPFSLSKPGTDGQERYLRGFQDWQNTGILVEMERLDLLPRVLWGLFVLGRQ